MQRNIGNKRWTGKSFWETLVREGMSGAPKAAMVTVALLQQTGLQIRAADVSIRVQKDASLIEKAG